MRKTEGVKKQKVLLVDDSPLLLKLGKEIFESGGYEVVGAKDGVEALKLLSHQTITIIITDILMPNMDGYSLCYNVRNNEKYNEVKIIIYSGTYISKNDEQLALEIGADMYIRKPASHKFLLDTTRNIIDRPRTDNYKISNQHELSEVTRLYSARFIEKLELKNQALEAAQGELIKSEKHFRALIENSFDAIFLRDENGMIVYQSQSVEKITGYNADEIKAISLDELIHPEDLPEILARSKKTINNPGMPVYSVNRMMHKGGYYIWIESITTNLLADEDIRAIVGNFRDITERKLADERVKKVSRLYAFISQVNQSIVHETNKTELYEKICRIAIDIGKYQMAWIGEVDEANRKISLVKGAGISSEHLPIFNNVDFADNGPQDRATKTGAYYVCNDVENDLETVSWKPFAAQYSLRSCMVLPIKEAGLVVATFNLYSSELNLFDDQEINLLVEVARDISFALDVFDKEKHRKKMENEINHSELRLKQAQAIAHFGSWELDYVTGIAHWSEEFCRIYGLTPEDNIQTYHSWISFIHPEDLEYTKRITNEARKASSNFGFHHRIILKDGNIKNIYSQAEFDFDSNGNPVSLHGVAHDITEMKEAQRSLAQSEANLSQIMDLIPQSIFTKDFDGKYIFANKTYASIYGYTPEQIIKKSMSEVIPEKGRAEYYLQEDREVILSGNTKIIPEFAINDYKGETRLLHILKVPFSTADSNKKSVLVVMNDITEQKKAEAERTKLVADIVHRNNDLEQFSYIISHNLRAPVANILGLVNLIQEVGLDIDEIKRVTNFLASASNNLDNIIKDLNHILELKNGLGVKREYIKFEEMLAEVRLSIDNWTGNDQADINFDFAEVPGIMTVKSYLYSIFMNLISNSIKYRQPGVLPAIVIICRALNNKIVLVFKDNGLGIDLKRNGDIVFGLYKRFHYHVGGKGMGLFMVKTQVELLGGKITVISEVNEGCEFRIEFDQ